MLETRREPVISKQEFLERLARQGLRASVLLVVALAIGVLGYHYLESLPWIDSLLNAAMILGGEGPVDQMHTVAGKLFASAYAIFSGVFFIALMGFLLLPVFHRFIHKFHVEETRNL